ncbi:MAG TPA: DUF1835 domain-containing protein [Steroidobacteraceae bacterium]|nr:DUF1835 domain-containing protein [Steroidobacteraceae bacterium]
MIKLLPPGLHVILGDSAGGIFTRVFYARDQLLIDRDVLSCGPTPNSVDLATWSQRRLEYWSSFVPGNASEHVHSRFNLVDNAQRLVDAERIHIWAGTGVSEQLFIAFVVHLVKLVGGDPTRLALVQFEKAINDTRKNGRVIGLGELDEAQMRAAPEPRSMPDDVAQQYLNAWTALTSPDPMLLARFAREHPEASRWLRLAMQLMTRRFPDKRNGLSYWDHALLARVKPRGPEVSRIIGYTMSETFELGDLVGDWYLFGRLLRLADARNPNPLLTLSGDQMSIRHTEAALTPFGVEVLKGATSNYPANPIDDWAAGVRLSSEQGALWFNDGGKLIKG